jgi:dTDP-4-dehydrorhamnose reductase
MSLRALIFGASGQVGSALQQTAPSSVVVVAHDLGQTDIRDRAAVARAVGDARPDVVINCAAFTNVDGAESHPSEAMEANGVAPGVIADVALTARVRFIHLSTDYVFDGAAHSPYRTDAAVAPINVYGATKLEGERRVLSVSPESVVVRTAWVHSGGGSNFVRTAVRLLSAGTPMRVVDDQIGTPTRARHLAAALWHITGRLELRGLLHFTDAGVASWFDVAVAVQEVLERAGRLGAGATVTPIGSDEFRTAARRPRYSVLEKHVSWNAMGYVPPHWRNGIIESTHELMNA